jgi:hypothetical protein
VGAESKSKPSGGISIDGSGSNGMRISYDDSHFKSYTDEPEINDPSVLRALVNHFNDHGHALHPYAIRATYDWCWHSFDDSFREWNIPQMMKMYREK